MWSQLRKNMCYKRLILYYITAPLLLTSLVNAATEGMDSKALSAAVTKFSAKFCNELVKDKSVVSSPLSAEFVLGLLALGATNNVHDELLASLEIPDDDSVRSAFKSVSSKLRSIKGVTLNAANKVYIMEGSYDLNEKLKEDAIAVFDAELEKMNFGNSGMAADTINKWVESKTNERIKNLLSADSLNSDTRLVLVNALYFKGTWAKQFERHMTTDRPFHVDETKTVQVPMMFKEDKFKYGESPHLKAQLLQMDYEGGEASMVIVLPNEINGLAEVMQKLASGHDLNAEIEKMHNVKVEVSVPKFKIETEIDLLELLPKLGIKAIFDSNNNGLMNILNDPQPLYVSKAVQKAFIEVNEEGAEAAAATGMVLMMRCMPRPSPKFVADRPFLYLLQSGNTPAFVGVYRAISVAFCSALVDFNPLRFTADRPFLAVIHAHGTPYFYTIYKGDL